MDNNCGSPCAVAKTMKIIGSKWTVLIVHNIFEGRNRFGLLLRNLNGISTKTLALRLQELEKADIITRKVYAEVPLHVEYFLTAKGHSLKGIIDQMALWGEHTQVIHQIPQASLTT